MAYFPNSPNDTPPLRSYDWNMGETVRHDWYLAAWLDTLDMIQARLCDRTGWDKRKASELVSGKQRYNRDTLNEAAVALNIAPFELLLHPADAMNMRGWRHTAVRIAAEPNRAYAPQPPELDDLVARAGKRRHETAGKR